MNGLYIAANYLQSPKENIAGLLNIQHVQKWMVKRGE